MVLDVAPSKPAGLDLTLRLVGRLGRVRALEAVRVVADVLAVEDLVTGPGGDARPRTGREQGGLVEPGHVEHQPRRHQETSPRCRRERGLDLLLPRLVLPRQDPHRDHHEREEPHEVPQGGAGPRVTSRGPEPDSGRASCAPARSGTRRST